MINNGKKLYLRKKSDSNSKFLTINILFIQINVDYLQLILSLILNKMQKKSHILSVILRNKNNLHITHHFLFDLVGLNYLF